MNRGIALSRVKTAVLLCLSVVAALLCVAGLAACGGDASGNLSYKKVDGGYAVTNGDRKSKSIIIPSEYEGEPVVCIEERAFSYCTELTSVEIPDSVTDIGRDAFEHCESLTTLNIGNGVTSIGAGAFYGCKSLTTLKMGNGVTSIGASAFYDCKSLTDLTISSALTSIELSSFDGCYNIKTVTMPTTAIVSIVGNEYITVSRKLQTVVINGGTSIGEGAFRVCSSLTSITIADSVTSIEDYAFSGCSSLPNIEIPDSVTSIGDKIFSDCSSLTSIEIPNSVTSIGRGLSDGCSSLTSISVQSGNTVYYSDGNCLIDKENKTVIAGCKNSVIPADGSVTSIGFDAFSGCSGLTGIEIPDTVTSIESGAFSGCSGLTGIEIPNGVTVIDDSTFEDCSSLTNVKIPDSVTNVRTAFAHCSSLASIELPDNITSIQPGAFYDTAYYNNASNWENEVLYIGKYLIEAKTPLTGAYTIKSGTLIIADYAFYDCSITDITIPDSVTSFGDRAFGGCVYLTSITFNGTTAQWNAISKGYKWDIATGKYTVKCTDGTLIK